MPGTVPFVLRSGESWADPWPAYAALRDHDPVHHVESSAGHFWVLTRHQHVYDAVRDHETFTSTRGLTVADDELEQLGLADNPPMVMTDPPVHTDFRRLVSRGFTPRQVEDVEPAVRAFVVERVEALRAAGGGDVVRALFKPLPSMVVAHYLGVPAQDRGRFDAWTDAIVAANAGGVEDAGAAVVEMAAYFTELVERRRREPGDDVVSHLVAAGVAGVDGDGDDDGAGLLRILAFTFTMVAGGNDTTTGLLGGGLHLLADRPDQRRLLRDDVPAAVEELLRATSPVQGLARATTRDVEVGGVTIPAGCKVLMCYGAANRDARAFGPDADDVDVTRRPRHILTFAHGAHHCLGAAAARMTARVALEELFTRAPGLEVDADSVVWAPGSYVRRPLTLRVTT